MGAVLHFDTRVCTYKHTNAHTVHLKLHAKGVGNVPCVRNFWPEPTAARCTQSKSGKVQL